MSSTLFSRTQRHDSAPPQPRRATTLETAREPEEGGSRPPSPSELQEQWWCNQHYRYLRGSPEASSKNPLATLNSAVESRDQELCQQLKDEINFLMVVAGLFLAIVTTFTVDSYKSLQEDRQGTMSDLLIEVVRLLNDTTTQGHATLPKNFTPDHRHVVVNGLWFSSITFSILTVIFGTLSLQWISAFSRGSDLNSKSISPDQVLALRQLRFEGMAGWGVLHAPEVLLFMVQISIALFTSGLIYFFWNINHRATLPALVMTCIAAALLLLVNSIPSSQLLLGTFFRKLLSRLR